MKGWGDHSVQSSFCPWTVEGERESASCWDEHLTSPYPSSSHVSNGETFQMAETSLTISQPAWSVGSLTSLKRNSHEKAAWSKTWKIGRDWKSPFRQKYHHLTCFWEGSWKAESPWREWRFVFDVPLTLVDIKPICPPPSSFFFFFLNLDSWQCRAVLSRHKAPLSALVPVSPPPPWSDSQSHHPLGSHHQSLSSTPWNVNTVSYVAKKKILLLFSKNAFGDRLM